MEITKLDTKTPELGMTEEIWLHYFNDVLRVRGMITIREYIRDEQNRRIKIPLE